LSVVAQGWVVTAPPPKKPEWLYLDEHGLTGPETGALLTMDGEMDVPFVRDTAGEWYFETGRRNAEGAFDMFGWTDRHMRGLERKGWVVACVFNENGKPIGYRRTDKRGEPWPPNI
jgi:hypothetical protein